MRQLYFSSRGAVEKKFLRGGGGEGLGSTKKQSMIVSVCAFPAHEGVKLL